MFAVTGRALARRIPLAATQLLAQPLALRPALAARPLTTSSPVLFAAAKSPSGATRKTSTSTSASASASAAKKTKAKKKPAKAKPKKAAKPPLSAEEKEELKLKKQAAREKVQLRENRALSLLSEEPASLPPSSWGVYIAQTLKSGDARDLASFTRSQSVEYRALSAPEREALEATARSNRELNEQKYKAWIESHPAERIYVANQARRAIQLKTGRKTKLLSDARLPKAGPTPYILFSKERLYAGPDEGDTYRDLVRNISHEWRGLSDAEKRPYEETWRAEKERHELRVKDIKERAKVARAQALADWEVRRAQNLELKRQERQMRTP